MERLDEMKLLILKARITVLENILLEKKIVNDEKELEKMFLNECRHLDVPEN